MKVMFVNTCEGIQNAAYPIRYEIRESTVGVGVGMEGEEERVLELVVTGVTRGDGGQYVCTAENRHGHASTTINLLVQGMIRAGIDVSVHVS